MATATQNVNDTSGPLPRFTAEVAGILRSAAESSRSTPPGDGTERGGLLLAVPEGDGLKIDRIETIPSEHRYGPEYRLSPDDLNVLRAKAAEVRASGLRKIVGYWRTSARDPLGFSLDENTVIREFVPECDWFAIAKAFADGSSRLRAFRYTGSGWTQAADFALTAQTEPIEFHQAQPQQQPALFRAATALITLLVSVPPMISGVVALMVVACVAWFSFLDRPAPPPPGLDMRIGADGNMLGLSWDAQTALGKSARDGTLRIWDGGRERDVHLDPATVVNGLVLYHPESTNVTFQLTVRGDHVQPLQETMQWLGQPDRPGSASFTVPSAPVAPAQGESATPVKEVGTATSRRGESNAAGDGLARFVVKTPGARVTVQSADDPKAPERVVSSSSMHLPAGRWIVRASAPGYRNFSRHFTVSKAEAADILISLQPIHGASAGRPRGMNHRASV